MRLLHNLTGFSGRVRRRDFWIGLGLLLLIEIVLSFGFAGLMRPTGATELERATMWLALAILLWGSAALIIKRLHDRDKSALWYPVFGLGPVVAYELGNRFSSNISNQLSAAQTAFWLLSAALFVWAIVELGFMKGLTATGPILWASKALADKAVCSRFRANASDFAGGAPLIPPSRTLPFRLTRDGAR